METFIDQVIGEVRMKFGQDFRNVCMIFPTRRACLIFRNRLAASLGKPVWSPGILGIGDFVSRHAQFPVSDEIPLLLSLFEVYKKYWPGQDFGKFYSWGQMLLSDFDEIDKQLSDPSRIFSNISELKKIDATFLPDPESLKWIHEFIASMDEKKLTKIQAQFANTWNRLKQIYLDYNQLLDAKGLAYEGKAYRDITGKLKNGEFKSPWKHFVFAGFYGFSRIEEDIIKRLSAKFKVDVLWDADSYYVNNKLHEAGYYFRKSPLCREKYNWLGTHFEKSVKKIEITGIPLLAGQAKYAGELLSRLQAEGKLNLDSTAVILPDENMLFPVLYSIPASVDPVNVTMGYPLLQSQYQELLKVLHELHKHSRKNKKGNSEFHYRYVNRLFNHPLFRGKITFPEKAGSAEHVNYLDAQAISEAFGFNEAGRVFPDIVNSAGVMQYLENVLMYLRDEIVRESGGSPPFEDKLIEYILTELKLLSAYTIDHLNEIQTETAWQMAKECISGLKVPFSGEPVHGLQVMGFLETRALDFQTVIILNVNEGVLPASSFNKSFIPFSLRKGYGLATYEDQDASYSYHFYRLLHKAENIFLIYNSEVSKTNGGEPSRYFLQLKQELARTMGDRIQITQNFINTPIIPESTLPVSIPKESIILEMLREYLSDDEGISKRSFSSSAITTYISCSLKFYYRYIAGLKEKINEEESIEDHIFGSILHKALEILYSKVNEPVNNDIIDNLLKQADNAVEEAVKDVYKIKLVQLEGADILLAEVIRELTKRILQTDKADTPFVISGLEKKLQGVLVSGNKKIGLYGSIDRLDEAKGVTRIIDYKTGKVELKDVPLEQLFHDPGKKALFQLHFYALLFNLNNPNKPVKTGFYLARSLGSGISWLGDGAVIPQETIENFKSLLAEKLTEIMNPAIQFVQTDDKDQCLYCPYKTICNR